MLHAYRRFGDRCLDVVTGRFALIVADRPKKHLLAARDGIGLYPLFYADGSNGLLFSSSIDALLAQPGVPRTLNRVVLGEHLIHRWVDPNETYFSAVHRVPPGHALTLDGERRSLARYWDPGANMQWLEEKDLDQFGSVFERAVERCVGQDRAAIFLSGGFDSVSVAAIATSLARRQGRPAPHALSIGFPDPECNEQFVQRSVAQSLGLTYDLVPFDAAVHGKGIVAPAVELGTTCALPLMNMWAPAYHELARRARPHGCATVLTGTGGDEWLNVTPFLAADLIRRGEVKELARMLGVFQRSFRVTMPQALRSMVWTFGLRPLAGAVADTVAHERWCARRRRRMTRSTPSWVAPDPSLRRSIDERAERVLPRSRPGSGGFYEREMRLALDHPLVAMEYEESFEFGRRFGIEMLHPYLDVDLVGLLYRTPPSLLTRGGRTKSLVRDTVARQFPELGFERQRKVDATNLYRTRLRTEAPAVWAALRGASALSELGVVEPAILESMMGDLFAGRRSPESYVMWDVLNLEAWVRARV